MTHRGLCGASVLVAALWLAGSSPLALSGDLVTTHGLIANNTYNATEAATNTTKLVDAIETEEPLTCQSGGTFWFDGPLPLTPAYRRNNTAYAIGDRVRGEGSRIYECITAGTTASSGGPTGTNDYQLDGTVYWDYIQEVGTWAKNGLSIEGPTSQHAAQAVEEYGYPQDAQLRFRVRLDSNTDTWMRLDDDQAPALWTADTNYVVGDVVQNGTGSWLYRCTVAGRSGSAASGGPTGTTSPITDYTAQWYYVCPRRVLTNINLRNFILQIEPPLPWQASRVYRIGDLVTNDGGKLYICDRNGSSAASGGPTGTGQDITDSTARWDYTTVPGCGSGIRVGSRIGTSTTQPHTWISARGVRIDGVYITGPAQLYQSPINESSQVLTASTSYGLQCNFVYDLNATNSAVRGFATGWDLYHADLPHVSYLRGMHCYRTLRHVSHPDNSARPGTYYKVAVESSPGVAIEMDSGLLVEPEVENGYVEFEQAGEFALPPATTWTILAGSDAISVTGAATFLQPGMPVRLDLTPAAWAPSTSYSLGALTSVTTAGVTRHYICTSAGTSAVSGTGPSGTGTGIMDGGAVWSYAPWAGTQDDCKVAF